MRGRRHGCFVEAVAAAAADAAMAKKEQKETLGLRVLTTRVCTQRTKEYPGKWIEPDELEAGTAKRRTVTGNEQEQSMTYPEHLPFHLIFCRLPVRQLLQLRCVCKLWNSMLGGAALASGEVWNPGKEEYWFVMWEALPRGRRMWNIFYTCSSQDWACFKAPLPSRCHGALANLLGGMHGRHLLPRLEYRIPGRCTPELVSAGGLMCAIVHRPGALDEYPVIVFNCLTGSVKVLPPPMNPGYLSASPYSWRMNMAIDEDDPARYYIMLARNATMIQAGEKFYSEIFDSRRGYWRVEGNIDSVAPNSSEVPHADFFFYAEYHRTQTAALLAYRTVDNAWSKVSVPRRAEFGCRLTFLKYKGRLLQGLQWRTPGSFCLGFVVWELKLNFNEAATWVEVARTPPEHVLDGVSTLYWVPQLKAEGSLFYMVFEDDYMAGRYLPPLVYDIAQNLWYCVPLEWGFKRFGCICVHRPRLSLRVPHLEGEEKL